MAWKTALRAADIMTRRMITVDSNASIREVAVVLVDNEISGAPVRDELGRITGLAPRPPSRNRTPTSSPRTGCPGATTSSQPISAVSGSS
jgi:CBS domain-containing protein